MVGPISPALTCLSAHQNDKIGTSAPPPPPRPLNTPCFPLPSPSFSSSPDNQKMDLYLPTPATATHSAHWENDVDDSLQREFERQVCFTISVCTF